MASVDDRQREDRDWSPVQSIGVAVMAAAMGLLGLLLVGNAWNDRPLAAAELRARLVGLGPCELDALRAVNAQGSIVSQNEIWSAQDECREQARAAAETRRQDGELARQRAVLAAAGASRPGGAR